MRKLVLPDLEDSPSSPRQRAAGGTAAAQHSAPEQNALPAAPHTSEGVPEEVSGARAAGSGSAVAGQWQSTGYGQSSGDAQTEEEDSPEPFSVRLPASAHRGNHSRLRVLDDSDAESPVSNEAAAEWDSDLSGRGASSDSSSVEALSSGLRTAVRQLGSSYRLGSALQPEMRPSR